MAWAVCSSKMEVYMWAILAMDAPTAAECISSITDPSTMDNSTKIELRLLLVLRDITNLNY